MKRWLSLSVVALAGLAFAAWYVSVPNGGAASAPRPAGASGAVAALPEADGAALAHAASPAADESDAEREAAQSNEPAKELEKRAATRCIGRVLGSDRKPLEGARVFLAGADRGPSLPLDAEVWQEKDRKLRTAKSDADGRFELADLRPGPTRIAVRADGYAPYDSASLMVVAETDNDAGEVALVPGVRLSGRVIDSLGAPVGGALLIAPFDRRDPSYRGRPGTTGIVLGTSDAAGAFEVGSLAVGPWTVLVRAEEFPDLALHGSSEAPGEHQSGLVAQFAPQAAIEGALEMPSNGALAKLEELSVLASYTGSLERAADQADFSWRNAKVDAGGHFRLAGLLADEPYRLRVRWHRWPDDWKGSEIGQSVDALAGDRGVLLRLDGFRAVRFEPVDARTGAVLEEVDASLWVGRADGRDRRLESLPKRVEGGWLLTTDAQIGADELVYVLARDAKHRARASERVQLAAQGQSDAGRLELEPLGVARVHVTDATTGLPIAGARLHGELVSGDDGARPDGWPSKDRRDGRGDRLRGGESDQGGVIEVYAGLGAVARACVTHDAYPSSPTFDLGFGAAGAAPTEIALELGASAEVSVLDAHGSPAPGIVVVARPPAPMQGDRDAELRSTTRQQRSELDGRALFARLTPGAIDFFLIEDRVGSKRSADDRAGAMQHATVAAGDTTRVTLYATARGKLSGRVLDGHRPLVGATIELRAGSAKELEKRKDARDVDAIATTDSAGRYAIERLGAGVWTLYVTHPGRIVPYQRTLTFEGEDEVLDLELPRCAILGRVASAGGEPIEGAKVVLGRMVEDAKRGGNEKYFAPYGGAAASVRTDAGGAFELRGVPNGVELAVSVEHERFQPERSVSFVLAPDELRTGVDFSLRLGATIAVEVLTSDGRAPRSKITARRIADEKGRPSKGPAKGAAIDGRGHARFTGLPGGKWRITVERKFDGQDEPSSREVTAETGREASVRFDVP